jgi:hypothetical protein
MCTTIFKQIPRTLISAGFHEKHMIKLVVYDIFTNFVNYAYQAFNFSSKKQNCNIDLNFKSMRKYHTSNSFLLIVIRIDSFVLELIKIKSFTIKIDKSIRHSLSIIKFTQGK